MPNQIYRGNSEQKLYYLLNNFVGGMNTVDVDEVVSPNEFRELKNVDLSKQGMLQNRKGFKHLKLLNWLLLDNGRVQDLLSDSEVLYFKVVEDNIKLLDVLSRYDDLETFKTDYADTYYYFHILLVTAHQNPARFEFNYITLENDNIDWEHYTALNNLYTGYGLTKPKTLTGITPVTLGNLMYFSIQDISVDAVGILELKMVTEMYLGETRPEVRLINASEGYYVTSPYDIEDEGYNLLAQNPILNVKQGGSIQNIRGITLVKRDNNTYYPLENIPTDGQFTALVMHTGTIPVSNIKERVYYYNTLGALVELERNTEYAMTFNDNLADGILMFDFDLAKVERRDVPIHIEFNVVDDEDIVVHQTFADLTTFENYYLFDTIGSNPANYFYDSNLSPGAFHLWEKTDPYKYSDLGRLYTSKQAPNKIGEYTYYLEAGTVYKYYGTLFVQYLYKDTNGEVSLIGFYQWIGDEWVVKGLQEYAAGTFKLTVYADSGVLANDYTPPENYPNTLTGLVSFVTNIVAVPNLLSRRPENIVGVIRITGEKDYVWNGTYTGVITDDFVEYSSLDSATSNFTTISQFGNNSLEPLVSLDLSNVKLATINERLVLYKGNTLWFSVYGNPNYFPYKNYVNLPLIGNDEIVSINYFRGSHIVFTKERIYRISGYYPDITITMINDSIGCIAPSSIKSFNNTLVFLTYDGLYRLKQNYYMDGLENVEKVDNKVNGLYPKDTNVESMLYNEQYLLYFKDNEDFDVLKYYYNINLPYDRHPFTIDKFAQYPDLLVKHDAYLLGIKHGELYVYDDGYTDFLLPVTYPTEQQVQDSTYKVVVKTCNMMLGYPTHDKKFKNLFIKTHTLESVPLSITTYVNDLLDLDPHKYYTDLTMLGEVEYIVEETPNLETTTSLSTLGSFELGISKLGKLEMNVHKIPLSSKGKYLQLILEQTLPAYFGIQDIGIVYKVNKIRAYQ